MRIVYIDIDSLRADHLGCYGYHRQTSPNIDRISADGVRFDNCYYSDGPCHPSRAALFMGRFGIHTGVVDHIGTAADPFVEGRPRGFRSSLGTTNWMNGLQELGYRTATVSAFSERHSNHFALAGFSDVHNMSKKGLEMAEDISSVADDWLVRHGQDENWFLHLNFWDVHWPYRTPDEFGNPFANDPIPEWLTEDIRKVHWDGCGIQSAQDMFDFHIRFDEYPKMPAQAASMNDVRRMFDGYDTGLNYLDHHIGLLRERLEQLGIWEDTAIVISSDHGENLGEMNIYAGHRFADNPSSRLPLIIRWPGVTDDQCGRVDKALYYQIDFAATVLELVGANVPGNWDGASFARELCSSEESGRDYLVLGAGAGGLSRAIRFEDFICLRIFHDGYQCLPDTLLFDIKNDPHEQNDLAPDHRQLVGHAMTLYEDWYLEMMRTATHACDNMWVSLQEGGPQDTRGQLRDYMRRLRETGRECWADELESRYPQELDIGHGTQINHGYK